MMNPQDFKQGQLHQASEDSQTKQLKVELGFAREQIETLEAKCKATLLENMNLKEENARLNELAAQAILLQQNEDQAVNAPDD